MLIPFAFAYGGELLPINPDISAEDPREVFRKPRVRLRLFRFKYCKSDSPSATILPGLRPLNMQSVIFLSFQPGSR